MTIKDIATSDRLSTDLKLEVLQRADVLLRDRCGRYFGGQLTDEEVTTLTPVVRWSPK